MGIFTKNNTDKINWKVLNNLDQLESFLEQSKQNPIAIFKHSTRCSLSSMVKSRLERSWEFTDEEIEIYYLDLLSYRDISNEIARYFSVEHQSPQLILLSDGEVVYHASHSEIDVISIKKYVK